MFRKMSHKITMKGLQMNKLLVLFLCLMVPLESYAMAAKATPCPVCPVCPQPTPTPTPTPKPTPTPTPKPSPTPSPSFTAVPMNSSMFNDYWNVLGNGGQIVYAANGVTYGPSATASKVAGGTASALLNTPTITTQNFKIKFTVNTVKQLRTSGPANAWEVAWFFFNFHIAADGKPAYNYISFKPVGIEFGMGYSGTGQTYLYTSSKPSFPIGVPAQIEIDKQGTKVTVLVNGVQAFSGTYANMYDLVGQFALYDEDSIANISNLMLQKM
jgi:hypothetical protein